MMRFDTGRCWCLLVSGLALAFTAAAANDDVRGDCDVAEPFTVLHTSAGPVDARALWLNRQQLQWPGAALAEGERLRLHHSATGALLATSGQSVQGAGSSFALQDASASPMPNSDRFRHLAAGPRAALTVSDAVQLAGQLPGQRVLTREAADGAVRDATTVQSPGLLDDLFAAAQALPDLGAHVQAHRSTAFKLWAPTARAVSVCLYPSGAGAAEAAIEMQRDASTGSWLATLPRDASGS
jgi:pullulanase